MILAQSAATAGVMAIDLGLAVQEVPYEALSQRLRDDKQILSTVDRIKSVTGVNPDSLPGIVVDDTDAVLAGEWIDSTASTHYLKYGYRHDGNTSKGDKTATFKANLPQAGAYEVRLAIIPHQNRSKKVKTMIEHQNGTSTHLVDQTRTPEIDGLWISMGVYDFSDKVPAILTMSNQDTEGHVVIDGVQWIPVRQ